MNEIRAISINLSPQVGTDDLLLWVPIIPDGRDGNVVYARTLRLGESNPHVPVLVNTEAGETLQFRTGSVEFSILDIDRHAKQDADGFAPISNTLWTWMTIGTPLSAELYYHLLATGRRLDGSCLLLREISNRMDNFTGNFIMRREQALQALSLAEILVVALSRAMDLTQLLKERFGAKATQPVNFTELAKPIRKLRDAIEHIEDRAVGQVRGELHPEAFSIFNQHEFISNAALLYGSHRISLRCDVPPLIANIRQYLMGVALEFAGPSKIVNQPMVFFDAKNVENG